jgi:hypothetical protein
MKTPLFSLATLIAIAAVAVAAPDAAPFINKQIKELEKQVSSDLASGALTKADGDELNRAIGEVRRVETSEPSLTGATRRDLREKLSKIQKDLERKENQAKALASASPSATP